jgi:hypothetical protein
MAGSVINTFEKGLNQDSSFILQPDGTYRNMKNGMLISYDNNHYTVEMTKGNRVLLTLTPRYLDDETTLDKVPMPIGFVSFIDKLVVFSTNDETGSGYGEIGVVTFVRNGNDFIGTYVPYYHHADLGFSKVHKIEGFSFRENDKIERVYWTDNNNEPRVFDIANPKYTDYFAPSPATPLTVGIKYMVLKGAVTHGGVDYGPGFTAGNIFTATGTSYVTLDGVPLVIEYVPIELLDWNPTRFIGDISFVEYGTGSKFCGSSIYFYRLSSSVDGFTTTWSYASNPIHVGMNNETTYLTGIDYIDFVGNGTSTTLENSGKSIKIKISQIDTNFDTIEVACAEYNQKTDVPYRIIITSKDSITGSEMTITDNGISNLGDVTISELSLFPATILKCKTLTTNKNYSIIANTTERDEFELDLSGVTVVSFEHPLISHGDLDSCANANVPADQSPDLIANPGAGDIKPNSRYLVSDAPDASNRVEYPVASGDYYYTGDVFVGVVGSTTATFTGTAEARPCAARNKYTRINPVSFSNDDVKKSIQLTTGFWDYKDPAIASLNKGYWSGERYRIGLLFIDLKGNPYYVKWLKDVDFPVMYDKGGLLKEDAYSGSSIYSLNVSGIRVSGLDIPESIMNNIKGFCIVRAERDKKIITQGLLTQNILNTTPSPWVIGPTLFMPNNTGVPLAPDIYNYTCPDYLTGYDFDGSIGAIGDKMEEAGWLACYDFGAGKTVRGDVNFQSAFTKMFENIAADANSPRKFEVGSLNGFGFKYYNENGSETNFDGNGNTYLNINPGLRVSVIPLQDVGCSDALAYNSFISSIGSKKIVLNVSDAIPHWNTSDSYSSNSAIANSNKLLVNCVTDLDTTSQYGGQSDAAKANTLYMSTGHFQEINAQVKTDTLNGTFASGPYAGENKYTFNNIEVFGGDCFTCLIDNGYGLWNEQFNAGSGGSSLSYAIWFPCECNVNYNLRRGLKVSNKNMYPTGMMAWITPSSSGILENYSYNLGYNSDGIAFKYPALPLNYNFTGKFEYRIRWSEQKFPGELNNSFRTFRIPDYRDVDGQKGQINNVKEKDAKLFYWQDHGVGSAPILERQLVGGGALGDATELGVTGVVDRYDVIDTYFGNQHQHGLTETEYGFAWFDMRNRAFMVMGVGSRPQEMSLVKGLQVFFNNEFNEGNINYPSSYSAIYNTNNLSVPEVPLMGYGIVGCYDPRFKMTYMTFKYVKQDFIGESEQSYVNKDFTIGYNHVLNAFVSFYDNCPAIWHNHNDLVLTANNSKNTKPYNSDMPPTTFVIGDTVFVDNVEYICINEVYIPSYPPASTKDPEYVGSIYWLAINSENQIYLQTFGADLCKFYGKVWDFEQEIVVNAKTDMAVTAQNIQVKTIGPNATSVYCDTDNQSSSDLNISSTNRNYRFIDGAWFSSLPLDKLRGRLTDYYVKIKFVHKNYLTNPTVSKNTQKVTQWLKTMFVTKR